MSPLEIVLLTVVVALGLSLLVLWIWMLVDCLRFEDRDGNDRLIWALVIALTKGVGAVIYYFVRYRPRAERHRLS